MSLPRTQGRDPNHWLKPKLLDVQSSTPNIKPLCPFSHKTMLLKISAPWRRKCSSSRKLVILFVVIAAAVIVLGLGALFLLFVPLSSQGVPSHSAT